jgi:hypothetical protein
VWYGCRLVTSESAHKHSILEWATTSHLYGDTFVLTLSNISCGISAFFLQASSFLLSSASKVHHLVTLRFPSTAQRVQVWYGCRLVTSESAHKHSILEWATTSHLYGDTFVLTLSNISCGISAFFLQASSFLLSSASKVHHLVTLRFPSTAQRVQVWYGCRLVTSESAHKHSILEWATTSHLYGDTFVLTLSNISCGISAFFPTSKQFSAQQCKQGTSSRYSPFPIYSPACTSVVWL